MKNKDIDISPVLKKGVACEEGLKYFHSQQSFKDAWNNCPRGDWMLWLANKLKINEQTLYLAKGYCAKTVIHLMKDQRSKNAVNITIKYGKGKTTKEELRTAAADAAYAAYAAAADAAYAAYAAAADAADAAAYAAYAAYAADSINFEILADKAVDLIVNKGE